MTNNQNSFGQQSYGGQQPYGGQPQYGGQQQYGGQPNFGGQANNTNIQLATLLGPPLAYNRGESQPTMGGEWRVFKAEDGWYDLVHKLKDGYFAFSAKTDDLDDVKVTMKALELSLFGGGFTGDSADEDGEVN